MKKILFATSIIISTVTIQATEHCDTLLKHGIINITKQKSAKHTIAYKWHRNCGTNISKANDKKILQAGISIFGFGSADSSDNISSLREEIQTWCKQNRNFAESRNDLYEEARVISEPALDAWNQCINNAREGVNINTSIQGENDDFIDFTIDSQSNGNHIFYGVSQVGYSCRIETEDRQVIVSDKIDQGQGKSLLLSEKRITLKNANIHVSCRRDEAKKIEVDGVGTLTFKQGHIVITTNGPALAITTPKVIETYYVTPPQSVIAFTRDTCPNGWDEYKPAYGRFIRGLDKSGEIDPTQNRKIGSMQDDMFKSHNHINGQYNKLATYDTYNTIDSDYDRSGGELNQRKGGNIQARGGAETRPKNVALLYCIKK